MADPEQEEVAQSVRETEDEILKSAFTPEAEPKAEPSGEEAASEAKGPARDPATGRFAKATPDEPQGEQPAEPVEKPDEILPSWRAREINEERRAALAELDRIRAENARMQTYLAQMQRAQPQQPAPAPDAIVDQAGFVDWMRNEFRREFQTFQQQQATDRLNNNLEMAHMRHGDKFEKAYEALLIQAQRGDSQIVRHFVSQPNPGEAIMRWYTNNETLREVGGDPAAFRQKTRDDLLKDPEFLAQAVEAHRRLATGGNGQPQNTVVKLPPSLSKATGTTEIPQTATDGSEAAIFAYAMQPKQRR